MKQILFLFLAVIVSANICSAQDSKYPQWSAAEVKKANTAAGVSSLSAEEQKVIYLCNLARLNGAKFRDTYAKGYLGNKSNGYISSLYSDLASVQNLPMLVPDALLCKSAAYHSQDMGNSGRTGHNSSDGTDCFARIARFGYKAGYRAENCSYGYGDAIGIVMQLLVDEGVSSLGHRKNILGPRYVAIGVSIKPHSGYRFNCTQDFGDNVNQRLGNGGGDNGRNDYNNYSDNDDDEDDDDDDDDDDFGYDNHDSNSGANGKYTEADMKRANTAAGLTQLTKEEQRFVLFVNLARLDGEKFWLSFAQPFLKSKNTSSKAVNKIHSILMRSKNLPMLVPDECLQKAAVYHCKDMKANNLVQFESSNGKSADDRIKHFGYTGKAYSLLDYEIGGAFETVMDFMVCEDDDDDCGMLKNLLDPKFKAIAAAYTPHPKHKHFWSITFGDIVTKRLTRQ